MELKRNLLRMDLQHFAEQGEGQQEEEPKKDEEIEGGNGEGEKHEGESGKGSEPKTFTQEEIDRIIADRLARERKKQEEKEQQLRDEAERKRLEENEEYKELAQKLQEQLDAIQGDALKAKKEAALVKAGYSEGQAELFTKLVDGDTDEEIQASVDELKSTTPPTKPYADPSTGNGHKQEPKKTDLQEKGKSTYQRLKERGLIRRK